RRGGLRGAARRLVAGRKDAVHRGFLVGGAGSADLTGPGGRGGRATFTISHRPPTARKKSLRSGPWSALLSRDILEWFLGLSRWSRLPWLSCPARPSRSSSSPPPAPWRPSRRPTSGPSATPACPPTAPPCSPTSRPRCPH